ncbi:hypothetical protein SLEP1_g41390 [Rubroshorea leprosula]|uniref:HAT C-terminal dimerisation domain-containing protein n=1 Tax=Rubroshorea leprosula TaxID=152421 RepID=A0AAV5L7P8_9ROSI|nr:hypothetical protein SLEP1_g41390 [Rubroshorea leprosula]
MGFKMRVKFNKYWGGMDKVNVLLLIAVVLEPHYKLEYVKFCFTCYCFVDTLNVGTRIDALMKKLENALKRSNRSKYRVLARMARDILSIPISTIVSEFAFSYGG